MRQIFVSCVLLSGACMSPATSGEPITKSRAAADDSDFDFCEEFGWYSDGVCDDFCDLPDPECPAPPVRTCGGFAGLACRDDEYCDVDGDFTCARPDASGVCVPRPESCVDEDAAFAPVCGCDQRTYDNACLAHAMGVDALHPGQCSTGPVLHQRPCSADRACPSGSYCNYDEVSNPCGWEGANGVCVPMELECLTSDEEEPVCGCDLTTYPNACVANAAGVDLYHSRSCAYWPENTL